jgi:hypothetical protein
MDGEFNKAAALGARLAAALELQQFDDRVAEQLREDLTTLSQNPKSWDSAVAKMKVEGPRSGISDVISIPDAKGNPASIEFVSANKSKSLNCEIVNDSWSCTLVKDETKSDRPMSSTVDKH